MDVKCKYCGKRIPKEDAIRVYEKHDDGYFCYCSKKCLAKKIIDDMNEED